MDATLARKDLSRKIAANGKNWRRALTLLDETLVTEPHLVDTIVYNTVLNVCAKCRRWREAVALLRNMQQQYTTEADGGTSTRRGNSIRKASLHVIQADLVSYHTTMNACVQCNQWEVCIQLFKELESMQSVHPCMQPNATTFNILMNAYKKAGNMGEEAFALLDTMRARGLQLDVLSISTCIGACVQEGNKYWRRVVKLLSTMQTELHVTPDTYTYSSTIRVCEEALQWEIAVELLRKMQQSHLLQIDANPKDGTTGCSSNDSTISICKYSYCSAMNACSRCGHGAVALKLFSELMSASMNEKVHDVNNICATTSTTNRDDISSFSVLKTREEGGVEGGTSSSSSSSSSSSRVHTKKAARSHTALNIDTHCFNAAIRACAVAYATEITTTTSNSSNSSNGSNSSSIANVQPLWELAIEIIERMQLYSNAISTSGSSGTNRDLAKLVPNRHTYMSLCSVFKALNIDSALLSSSNNSFTTAPLSCTTGARTESSSCNHDGGAATLLLSRVHAKLSNHIVRAEWRSLGHIDYAWREAMMMTMMSTVNPIDTINPINNPNNNSCHSDSNSSRNRCVHSCNHSILHHLWSHCVSPVLAERTAQYACAMQTTLNRQKEVVSNMALRYVHEAISKRLFPLLLAQGEQRQQQQQQQHKREKRKEGEDSFSASKDVDGAKRCADSSSSDSSGVSSINNISSVSESAVVSILLIEDIDGLIEKGIRSNFAEASIASLLNFEHWDRFASKSARDSGLEPSVMPPLLLNNTNIGRNNTNTCLCCNCYAAGVKDKVESLESVSLSEAATVKKGAVEENVAFLFDICIANVPTGQDSFEMICHSISSVLKPGASFFVSGPSEWKYIMNPNVGYRPSGFDYLQQRGKCSVERCLITSSATATTTTTAAKSVVSAAAATTTVTTTSATAQDDDDDERERERDRATHTGSLPSSPLCDGLDDRVSTTVIASSFAASTSSSSSSSPSFVSAACPVGGESAEGTEDSVSVAAKRRKVCEQFKETPVSAIPFTLESLGFTLLDTLINRDKVVPPNSNIQNNNNNIDLKRIGNTSSNRKKGQTNRVFDTFVLMEAMKTESTGTSLQSIPVTAVTFTSTGTDHAVAIRQSLSQQEAINATETDFRHETATTTNSCTTCSRCLFLLEPFRATVSFFLDLRRDKDSSRDKEEEEEEENEKGVASIGGDDTIIDDIAVTTRPNASVKIEVVSRLDGFGSDSGILAEDTKENSAIAHNSSVAPVFQHMFEKWVVYPGLFATGSLDIMTTVLLETFEWHLNASKIASNQDDEILASIKPQQHQHQQQQHQQVVLDPYMQVIDWACGSGVIGAYLLLKQPLIRLHMIDADSVALYAAKENIGNIAAAAAALSSKEQEYHQQSQQQQEQQQQQTLVASPASPCYYVSDCWHSFDTALDSSIDLILSNPPVHEGLSDSLRVVEELIADSLRFLRPGKGTLWIVAQECVPIGGLLERYRSTTSTLSAGSSNSSSSKEGFSDIRMYSQGRFTVWVARRSASWP